MRGPPRLQAPPRHERQSGGGSHESAHLRLRLPARPSRHGPPETSTRRCARNHRHASGERHCRCSHDGNYVADTPTSPNAGKHFYTKPGHVILNAQPLPARPHFGTPHDGRAALQVVVVAGPRGRSIRGVSMTFGRRTTPALRPAAPFVVGRDLRARGRPRSPTLLALTLPPSDAHGPPRAVSAPHRATGRRHVDAPGAGGFRLLPRRWKIRRPDAYYGAMPEEWAREGHAPYLAAAGGANVPRRFALRHQRSRSIASEPGESRAPWRSYADAAQE